jgi:hypothetical protein
MTGAFARHMAFGQAMKFCVDQRRELFQSLQIAFVPGD